MCMKKIFFLRGIVVLIEFSVIGFKYFVFVIDWYDEDLNNLVEEEKIEKKELKVVMWFGVVVIGILFFVFVKFVMMFIFVFLVELFCFIVLGDMV